MISKYYSKNLPPSSGINGVKFKINMSVNVMDIQDINEVKKTFILPFVLYLTWIDGRLEYKTLNKDKAMNKLDSEETGQIWSPKVIFQSTNEKFQNELFVHDFIYFALFIGYFKLCAIFSG